MVTVDGVKFISQEEFDAITEKHLDKACDKFTDVDPVKGLVMSMLLALEMGAIRAELFQLNAEEEDE